MPLALDINQASPENFYKNADCLDLPIIRFNLKHLYHQPRFHGVMVSTQDSESCDPSSSLGGTYTFFLY